MTQQITKPRIVIYGTGRTGQTIARLAIQKGWTIAAAFNRAGPKVGQDIGRLAGLDRDIGVVVQDCETATYANLDAKIGIVTVTDILRQNLPAYQRLLGAGLNVICHGTEAYDPFGNDAEVAAQIDKLAKSKGVTFSGGGIWDMSRIWSGILVAGPCTELKSMFHSSLTDCSRFGKPAMLHTGVGKSVDEFKQMAAAFAILKTYKTIPQHVLDALGYAVTDVLFSVEPVTFDTPRPLAASTAFWA